MKMFEKLTSKVFNIISLLVPLIEIIFSIKLKSKLLEIFPKQSIEYALSIFQQNVSGRAPCT